MLADGMHCYWIKKRGGVRLLPWVPTSYPQGIAGNRRLRTFIIGESSYDDWERYATTYWITKFLTGSDIGTYLDIERSITGSPIGRDFEFWKTVSYMNFFQEPVNRGEPPKKTDVKKAIRAFKAMLNCPNSPELLLIFSTRVWNELAAFKGSPGPAPKTQIPGRTCEMRIFTTANGADVYAGRIDHPSYWWKTKPKAVNYTTWHRVIKEYIALVP